jgi:hypothetical protein
MEWKGRRDGDEGEREKKGSGYGVKEGEKEYFSEGVKN